MTVAATRRAERRQSTVAEIKAAAWADMAEAGTTDCSLRGVARRLGMAPSALYRYFPSRNELLSALIVDAFDDLTATLAAAHRAGLTRQVADRPGEVFVSVAAAYRRWALADRLRYRLVFGTPVGGYVGTPETTAASLRSSAVLLEVMADLVATDGLDVDRLQEALSAEAEASFASWSSSLPQPLPPVALAAAITCYAALHGAIGLEVNGHLPPPLRGEEQVYLDSMRQVVGSMLR